VISAVSRERARSRNHVGLPDCACREVVIIIIFIVIYFYIYNVLFIYHVRGSSFCVSQVCRAQYVA